MRCAEAAEAGGLAATRAAVVDATGARESAGGAPAATSDGAPAAEMAAGEWSLLGIASLRLLAAWLGGLPGRIARSRDHPQAEAINACGWLGLITLGVPWIVAMVWAFVRPGARHAELIERVARLEAEIARLRGGKTTP